MQLSLLFKYTETANSLCKINTLPLVTHAAMFYHSTMGTHYLNRIFLHPPLLALSPISSTKEFCFVKLG